MINIQNIDSNDCFEWRLVRYLHLEDHHPPRIPKTDKDFARKLDFKDTKLPVKIRDIHKTEKRVLSPLVFFGYKNKKKYSTYVSKKCSEKKTC